MRPLSQRNSTVGRPSVGLAATLTATVPLGAGLSSSAALEVAIATALCAVAAFELEPLELADACRRAELRAVGVPCGILDQAAAVLGRADQRFSSTRRRSPTGLSRSHRSSRS